VRLTGEVGYHNSVLRDLSRETGISLRVLQQSVAFRDAYSNPPVGQELTWSHYRVLVRVPTAKQRKFYAELARKNGWTSRELQNAIATDLFDGGTIEVLVDLGFHSLTQQRLRLAQIDAPEIQSKAGRDARNFLVETVAAAKTTVLQTIKIDFHGRYVAHVFCAKQEVSIDACFEQRVHINDLMVREKHAQIVG